MVTSGIKVARNERRNRKITRITSATASKMVVKTDSTERSMNNELS
jgi:hypothetical protein